MTSEYSKEHDPLGHSSGALRVPQEMMRTYDQLRDYVKRQMVRMLSAEGRGVDAHLAHLATGEMVLPRQLLDGDPWLPTYLVRVFEDADLDWRVYLVGGPNRINPATGLPEFDPSGERDEGSDADRGGGYSPDGSGANGAVNGQDNSGGESRAWNSNLGGGVVHNALYGGPPELPNPSMEDAVYDPTGQSVRWAGSESDDLISRARGVQQNQNWAGDYVASGSKSLVGGSGHVSALDTSEHYLKPGKGDAYGWVHGDPYSDYEKSLNRVLPEIQRVIPDVSRASSYAQPTAPKPSDRWCPEKGEVKHQDLWRALEEILAPIGFGRPGE